MTEGRGRSRKKKGAVVAPVQRADAAPVESPAELVAAAVETIGAGSLGDRASGDRAPGSSEPGNGALGNGAPAPVADGPTDEAIRARAYQLYLERGGVGGRDLEDWLAAERSAT